MTLKDVYPEHVTKKGVLSQGKLRHLRNGVRGWERNVDTRKLNFVADQKRIRNGGGGRDAHVSKEAGVVWYELYFVFFLYLPIHLGNT